MNGTKPNGLLALTGDPRTTKDKMLSKMAKIPPGYTHVGLANTEVGLTAVIAHEEWFRPLVWEPIQQEWVDLKTKTDGGLIVGHRHPNRKMPS